MDATADVSGQPSFSEATHAFARIGLLSFGGPAGQIALMHRILVDEKKWLDEKRFLHALNYCMLLPGPEAMQLATYAGWLLHGVRGGLVAGLLFVLPGAVVITLLSALYLTLGHVPALGDEIHQDPEEREDDHEDHPHRLGEPALLRAEDVGEHPEQEHDPDDPKEGPEHEPEKVQETVQHSS